ncbi:MAG: type II secretion system F family protein [Deltaproteobacteria bacterium]|jgi:Flp pilus assembly protein TadB|nr:type II secretion system F family protein [Deltaproteobacteria bacterium]
MEQQAVFFLILLLLFGYALFLLGKQFRKNSAKFQLSFFNSRAAEKHVNWDKNTNILNKLRGRFGRAGFISSAERSFAFGVVICVLAVCLSVGLFLGFSRGTTVAWVLSLILSFYLAVLILAGYFQYCTNKFKQTILFQTPIILENLILLISAGQGVLPALEKITANPQVQPNKTLALFRLVYQLTASGIPFSEALEKVANATNIQVLRHVLIYLDISNSQGGELVPALQSLSEHTHIEWRLAVESRIKRLENLVVLPVFFAVLGLVLVVAAVPILPVININNNLSNLKVENFNYLK